jgi:hypothetical protein
LSYGDVDIDKQLHIIGPGFNVSGGILGNYAEVGIITFVSAANTSGSSIQGIKFSRFYVSDPASGAVFSNFQILRCLVTEYLYTYNDVLFSSTIEGCIFPDTSYNLYPSDFENCTIRNNFFGGLVYSLAGCTFQNNISTGAGSTVWLQSPTNSNISNNIAIGRNIGFLISGNTVSGNCAFSCTGAFPGVGSNFVDVDPLFEAYVGPLYSWAADYNLSETSPLIGAGAGGEDIGLYGGEGVFRKDCEPTIPIIRSVNIPGGTTVPANATFNINITSEAHE